VATEKNDTSIPYDTVVSDFIAETRTAFEATSGDVRDRNDKIEERDQYIYSDLLERSLDIPLGHDFTSVNWLRRTVEIHKNMFMGRGFQPISVYDTNDIEDAEDPQAQRLASIENRKRKTYAELRQNTCINVINDNGGMALFGDLAENASAVGDSAIKAYYDYDQKKYVLSPIESIEHLYVLWDKDDFRRPLAYAYVFQVEKSEAIRLYDAPQDVATSPVGEPFNVIAVESTSPLPQISQPMVTIMEVTGIIPGWGTEKGKVKHVKEGKENRFNCKIIGDKLKHVIDDETKIPYYYILPNKRQRRRAWGQSDISDAAIQINQTYIETLSDWRTVSSKVNFPKYKAYNFGLTSQLPKSENRKVQILPLGEGQDLMPLDQGSSSQFDFQQQLDECKEQFVRETGISRVLFDDPSVTFNSNQALLTSMKPTSDIAEAKKQLWTPILQQIFVDMLDTMAKVDPDTYGELVSSDDNWSIKIMWPSIMQKEDPIFQNMLLNRLNAGTISLASYLEQQGETKEEIDRIREELSDPTTAAVLGKQMPLYAQQIINFATAELQAYYQATLPQNNQQNTNQPNQEDVNSNGGTQATPVIASQAENFTQPVSQPGSGASATTNQGAVNQIAQNMGA